MDTEPDFSIITPSYNYARYVRECIEERQKPGRGYI